MIQKGSDPNCIKIQKTYENNRIHFNDCCGFNAKPNLHVLR